MKQNQNTLILTATAFILLGLLLIYRAKQTNKDFFKLKGTVTSLQATQLKTSKTGNRYSLDFSFIETDKVYGIYVGTKEQAENNNLKRNIVIGKTYTFYIDKTILPGIEGHYLGIREIWNHGKLIYRDSSKANYFGGSILISIGVLSLALLFYVNRQNNTNLSIRLKRKN